MLKWFTFKNDSVNGPFSTDDLKVAYVHGQIDTQTMIWSRIQKDWRPAEEWFKNIDATIIHISKSIKISGREWYYGLDGESFGPFTRNAMMETLIEKVQHLDKLLVWTTGMEEWESIFEFHDILDEMGINQRKHKRAQIKGHVFIDFGTGNKQQGQLASISEGGIGFTGIENLIPGQELFMEIQAPIFNRPIRVNAEIKYLSESGFAGASFTQIHSEAHSTIIDYLRKSRGREVPFKIKQSA